MNPLGWKLDGIQVIIKRTSIDAEHLVSLMYVEEVLFFIIEQFLKDNAKCVSSTKCQS